MVAPHPEMERGMRPLTTIVIAALLVIIVASLVVQLLVGR